MVSSLKQSIEEIVEKKAPGPNSSFSLFNLFYALELMEQTPIGRIKLAEKIEVGNGAIRTIISRLKDSGLIDIAKEGCSLTARGLKVWEKLEDIFPKRISIPKTDLTPAEYNYAFLIKNSAQKISSGINERDEAIIAGASRALAIVCKNGKLSIPSASDNVQTDYPKASEIVLKELKPKENDVIIIVGADSMLKAKSGAFAASWSLIE